MSMATLLEPFGGGLECDDPARNVFDIHGGGIDLVFPHHENEIAQSCSAFHSRAMANVWMHNGFLQVEGEKMAKSAGNFVTIHELLRGWFGEPWSGAAIRFAMLGTHYRQPIDWTRERLREARINVMEVASSTDKTDFVDPRRYEIAWREKPRPSAKIMQALLDDLNTAEALASIKELISKISKLGDDERVQTVHDLRFVGVLEERQREWLTATVSLSSNGRKYR